MRILSLVHGPTVRSELWGEIARQEGHELLEWELPTQGAPPRGFDAVWVFGGHQNVGEELQHPWLTDEYELIRGWVEAATPFFGICLGGQALAHALGGEVARVPQRLAGFYETTLTEQGMDDRVLGALPHRFEALNANAYAFTVPDGTRTLATGPVPQAFRVGERAWGVQFHPEARHEQVVGWWQDREGLPAPVEQLEGELTEKLPRWQELGGRLCRAFLDAAAG